MPSDDPVDPLDVRPVPCEVVCQFGNTMGEGHPWPHSMMALNAELKNGINHRVDAG
jgi:hypothetical protein